MLVKRLQLTANAKLSTMPMQTVTWTVDQAPRHEKQSPACIVSVEHTEDKGSLNTHGALVLLSHQGSHLVKI